MLKAGAARVDITPDKPVWMDGNPRDRQSEGVHDPLTARALVFEGDEGGLVLISCELIGLADDTVVAARELIRQKTGIPPERQVLSCGHVHSAVAVRGYFCPREDQYVADLVVKLGEVAARAKQAMVPALAGAGSGEEYTISEYRRLWTKSGQIVMNWDEFEPEDILGPAGPTDPEVGVVRIDGLDGTPVAVIYNHAGHPNTPPGTWFEISGDYPAVASAMIERELGGVALFTNGAQGSVDVPAFRERDWEGVERRGTWLGREVLRVAKAIRPTSDLLAVRRQAFCVGPRQFEPDYIAHCRKVVAESTGEMVNIRDGINEEMYAQRCLDHVDSGVQGFDTEMTAFAVGGAGFVSIAGELFTEIGLRIKRASPFPHTYIVDLANGALGYIPTERAFREGGYTTRCSRLDVRSERVYTEHALGLLGRVGARVGALSPR